MLHRLLVPETHWNSLCDPDILPDAKTQDWCNVPDALFMETAPGPPEYEK
jgi:hypothetical protein